MTLIQTRRVDYTLAGLEDRMVYSLGAKCDIAFIEEEMDNWGSTKSIHLFHPYLEHAQWVLYRINIFRPPPIFVISEKDIPDEVASTFEEIGEVMMSNTITAVVRRILESVNPVYFHTNGIFGKVKWMIES